MIFMKSVTVFCDLDSVPESRFDNRRAIPKELIESIQNKGVVPERYWYLDDTSASTYHVVTDDSEYKLSEATENLLRSSFPKIVDIILSNSNWNSSSKISLADLGVGTPSKDIMMLKSILEKKNKNAKLIFMPIDISFPLLASTTKSVLTNRNIMKIKDKLEICPYVGDFTKLNTPDNKKFFKNKGQKIITLLGTTSGNFVLSQLFEVLADCMNCDDYFVVDFEFADYYYQNEADLISLKKRYDNDSTKEFVLHPLSVSIRSDETVDSLKKNINVFVGRKDQVNEIEHAHEYLHMLDESLIACMVFNVPQKMKNFEGFKHEDILLAWNVKHTKQSLENLLSETFEIVNIFTDKYNPQYGMYLLKKKYNCVH